MHPLHADNGAHGPYGIAEDGKKDANRGKGRREGTGHDGGRRRTADIGLRSDSDEEEGSSYQFGHNEQDHDVNQHPEESDGDS